MIEQVLQRAAVLQQLQVVKTELSRPGATRRRIGDVPLPSIMADGEKVELTEEDLRVAAAELENAQARENRGSSGQPGLPPLSSRRGETAPPLDNVAFLSRDPAIGLLQSALEQYHLEKKPTTVAPVSRGRRSAGEWKGTTTRRLLNEFSETDPRWVASVVAMGLKLFREPHPFKQTPVDVRIGNQARMIVVGDWGSGIDRAQKIAKMIRIVIEEGRRDGREQHVVHLGDVYYSGWGWECQSRFLDYWPITAKEGESISSWSLNGNHDMYSGGYGYFDRVLADPRFRRQEGGSYFRLFNDDWQLLGLDTAHRDNALREPQSEWVRQQTTQSQRKTMLMSHHQPFTVYEKHSIEIDDTLKGVLRDGAIRAWLFGHEHRCILYSEHMGIKYPRLIGHGGVPVYMAHHERDPFPPPVAYEYRKYIPGGPFGVEPWAPFGFAVLDFDGSKISSRYFYEDGFAYPAREEQPETID
jgi:hypothetical protein